MRVKRSSDFDIPALYAAIDTLRQSRALSWQQVVREIGVSHSTLVGLRTRRAVEGDGVLQMLLWLHRTPESFVPGCDTAASPPDQSPDAPNCVLRFDTRAIYAALDAQRARKGLTWTEVAQRIGGLKPASLTRLSKGGRTSFPQVMRIVAWLGRPALTFTRISTS